MMLNGDLFDPPLINGEEMRCPVCNDVYGKWENMTGITLYTDRAREMKLPEEIAKARDEYFAKNFKVRDGELLHIRSGCFNGNGLTDLVSWDDLEDIYDAAWPIAAEYFEKEKEILKVEYDEYVKLSGEEMLAKEKENARLREALEHVVKHMKGKTTRTPVWQICNEALNPGEEKKG